VFSVYLDFLTFDYPFGDEKFVGDSEMPTRQQLLNRHKVCVLRDC
jgi:hypothetical protein